MSIERNSRVNVFLNMEQMQLALNKADADVVKFTNKLEQLKGEGKANTQQFEAYAVKLDKAREQSKLLADTIDGKLGVSIRQAEKDTNALAAAIRKMPEGHQDREKLIAQHTTMKDELVKMKTEAGLAGSSLKNAMGSETISMGGKLGGVFVSLRESISSLIGPAALAFGAMKLGKDAFDEFDQAETAALRLQNSLKNMGKERYFDEFNHQADELAQRFKTIDNDIIVEAQTKLITYGKLTKNQILDVMPTIIDLAHNMGVTIPEATGFVIKALEGNAKALKEYGINIKDGGSVTERFAIIQGDLAKKVAGSTETFEAGQKGFFARMKQQYADAAEAVGRFFLETEIAHKSESDALRETSKEFNGEIELLTKGNLTQAERVELIGRINTKYGEYLPNLLSEKSSLGDIEKAQKAVNDQLLMKAIYIDYEKEITEAVKKQADAYKMVMGARIANKKEDLNTPKIVDGKIVGNIPTGGVDKMGKAMSDLSHGIAADGDNILKKSDTVVKGVEDYYGGLAKEMGTTMEKLKKSFSDVGKAMDGDDPDKDSKAAKLAAAAEKKRMAEEKKEIDAAKVIAEVKEKYVAAAEKSLTATYKDALTERENDLKASLEKGQITQQQYDEQSKEEKIKLLTEEIEAYKKLGLDSTQLEKELLDTKLALNKDHNKEKLEDLETTDDSMLNATKAHTQKIIDEENKGFVNWLKHNEKKIEETEKLANATTATLTSLNTIQNNQENIALHKFEKGQKERKDVLDQRLKDGVISQKEHDKQMLILNDEVEKKQRQVAHDQAVRTRDLAMVEATIQGALGVARALASAPPPFNVILAVAQGIAAAAQVAAIASTEIPAYALGGMNVPGGMALVGEKGPEIVQLNGGENIYDNVKTKRLMQLQPAAVAAQPTIDYGGLANSVRQTNRGLIGANQFFSDFSGKMFNQSSSGDMMGVLNSLLDEAKKNKPAVVKYEQFKQTETQVNSFEKRAGAK